MPAQPQVQTSEYKEAPTQLHKKNQKNIMPILMLACKRMKKCPFIREREISGVTHPDSLHPVAIIESIKKTTNVHLQHVRASRASKYAQTDNRLAHWSISQKNDRLLDWQPILSGNTNYATQLNKIGIALRDRIRCHRHHTTYTFDRWCLQQARKYKAVSSEAANKAWVAGKQATLSSLSRNLARSLMN